MAATKHHEMVHERSVTERVALVRLVLCGANFAVISLGLKPPELPVGVEWGPWIPAWMFLIYAALAWLALKMRWVALAHYELATPFFDVSFATLLILGTGGLESPFNLWIVFAVVATGFSGYRHLPLVATLFALAAHALIGATRDPADIDIALYTVRTAYLLGFAAVVASAGLHLTRQSEMIAVIEQIGNQMAQSQSESEVLATLERGILELFPEAKITFEAGGSGPFPLDTASERFGAVHVRRVRALRPSEERVIRTLADRAASAIARHRLSQQVVETVMREERLRLADELHDTYLQTLAAIDLRAEAARINLPQDAEASDTELGEIKRIARVGAARAREFIQKQQTPADYGAEVLTELLATRWEGEHEVHLEEGIDLSEAQWNALELMVKEGLNNARRHGSAKKVKLRLEKGPAHVVALLENDGATPSSNAQFGYGLSRLRDAVRGQGGELLLSSGDAGNTVLSARFKRGDAS